MQSLWLNNESRASDNTQADTSELNLLASNSPLPSDQQPMNNIPAISPQASRQQSQNPSSETLETQDIIDSEQEGQTKQKHNLKETVSTNNH